MVSTLQDLFRIGKTLWSDRDLTIFFHPLGNCHFFFELIHLIFMIYQVTSLPIIVGFRILPDPGLVILELVSCFDYFLFIFISMRTPNYNQGILEQDPAKVKSNYLNSNKFKTDFIGFLPFHLIIWLSD
jgi:hypothetical protein